MPLLTSRTRAAVPEPIAGAARRRPLRFIARVLLGLVAMAWIVLVACWLSLHWLILPHIDRWRVPIEERASALLGAPVKIGAIEVRSNGWVPALELREVRILDAQQRVALDLPRVSAAVSARSLMTFELRFEQLLIDGPSLDVRRGADGHIRVAGIDFGGNTTRAGDWRRWSGSVFADLPRADVRELRRHVSLPFELSEGDGALRGWFELKNGLPERATVDLALRAVRLRLEKTVEPLEFEQIEGRIEAARAGDRT